MKSIVMKSIYTGLGLLGSGKETVEELGRKLARQANLSEQDGKKIARQLRARSQKAVDALHKSGLGGIGGQLLARSQELTPTATASPELTPTATSGS